MKTILIILFLIIYLCKFFNINLQLGKLIFVGILYLYIFPKLYPSKDNLKIGCKIILNTLNVFPINYGKLINKPKLIICNHFTHIDAGLIKLLDPNILTISKHDASSDFFLADVAKQVLQNWGTILYERGNKESGQIVRQKIKDAIINKKKSVLVFPEGKTYGDGAPNHFYPGSFEVAWKNRITVQPVVLKYNHNIAWSELMDNPKDYNKDLYKNLNHLLNHNTVVLVDILEPIEPKYFISSQDFINYIKLSMTKSWFNLYRRINKLKLNKKQTLKQAIDKFGLNT